MTPPKLTTAPGRPCLVGIDLGTTNSLVAVLQDGLPVVIPNAVGEALTPSAVSIGDDGEVLVGAAALARAASHPERTATAFKRDMGTDRRYSLGGRSLTPPELSAMVLRALRQDAEAALGRTVDEAVITVPAYFDELQRRATRDAAAIAGLKVERIINEPTAAALAYGLHQRDRELRIAVLDLGGGTFDVTVLEIIEGVIEIRSTAGDTRLGGEDFVDTLAEIVVEKAGRVELREDRRAWAVVRAAVEAAKRRLSAAVETEVLVVEAPVSRGKPLSLTLPLTREVAESAWAPLTVRLRAPVLRALRDAGLGADAIDEVLLVGGATRMPCVARLAAELFGKMPLRVLPPDEAVAYGAAVQAALKGRDAAVEDMVVTDVAPFSMGVATASRVGVQTIDGLFTPIIERGTVIPASRSRLFSTMGDNQTHINLEVFQGEHALCRDNRKLGELKLGPLLPRPAGQVAVEVRFSYDLNGLLEVDTFVPDTGQKKSLLLEQTPGRLSAEQIAEARRNLERLKFHPREALPNTTALARGEALFVQLTGSAREELAGEMTRFRHALETQDPEGIDEARERLVALTAALSRSA
jgi:molecular chaperone HscC